MKKHKQPTTTQERNAHTENAKALEEFSRQPAKPAVRAKKDTTNAGSPQGKGKPPTRGKQKAKPTTREQYDAMFEELNEAPYVPSDYQVEVAADSLEARIGYRSLFRQMEEGLLRRVAYYRSDRGG